MKRETGEQMPLEIERKLLIEYPDLQWLQQYPGLRKIGMIQTYLKAEPGEARRVRQCTEQGSVSYYRTSKRKMTAMTRIEVEEQLSQEEYLELLREADPSKSPIIKTRYCIPYDGHVVEIDIYPFWTDKAIAEIELERENEAYSLPEQIHIIADVSDDERYSNYSLARNHGIFDR